MNKVSILIVEDDQRIQNLLSVVLDLNEYIYYVAETGNKALSIFETKKPDILLLDLGLPDIDGIEVIKEIRKYSNCPILVVSARMEDEDKIQALDAGADDYLIKPFSVDELLARIRVSVRRLDDLKEGQMLDGWIQNGNLRIDRIHAQVFIQDQEIHLTKTEYKLLVLLAENVGKVLTYATIINQIWRIRWDEDVADLRVFITNLRRKLEIDHVQYIQTQLGVGYRMLKS